jgi:hypothetical protein
MYRPSSIIYCLSMVVSVPEKTLEHWSSQYIVNRYAAGSALWWPADGEDINVDLLPTKPGKAVQLELKTTTVVRPGFHKVMVDLGQLWSYRQLPSGRQPFYAFPWPHWIGSLRDDALTQGCPPAEMAFARSGSPWWFAEWMVILTAEQVAAVLRKELAQHNSAKRGVKKCLVRFKVDEQQTRGKDKWGHDGKGAKQAVVEWLDFWPRLQQCGEPRWPQLIRLPVQIINVYDHRKRSYRLGEVAEMLRGAIEMSMQGQVANESLATLEPNEEGIYTITRDYSRGISGSVGAGTSRANEHRLVVFLEAGVMRP